MTALYIRTGCRIQDCLQKLWQKLSAPYRKRNQLPPERDWVIGTRRKTGRRVIYMPRSAYNLNIEWRVRRNRDLNRKLTEHAKVVYTLN